MLLIHWRVVVSRCGEVFGAIFMGCIGADAIFLGYILFFVIGAIFIGCIVNIIIIIVVIHCCGDVMCMDTIILYF